MTEYLQRRCAADECARQHKILDGHLPRKGRFGERRDDKLTVFFADGENNAKFTAGNAENRRKQRLKERLARRGSRARRTAYHRRRRGEERRGDGDEQRRDAWVSRHARQRMSGAITAVKGRRDREREREERTAGSRHHHRLEGMLPSGSLPHPQHSQESEGRTSAGPAPHHARLLTVAQTAQWASAFPCSPWLRSTPATDALHNRPARR